MEGSMRTDIRSPIGWMFSILGAMLVLYGLTSSKEIYARSLGINVNLWWGAVLLVFGIFMLWLARSAAAAEARASTAP